MRVLNQMLNLSRIFDCFIRRFGKVVFNLKLSNLVDSDVASQSSYRLRIKLGTCEIRRLNWVMITVASFTKKYQYIRYDTYGSFCFQFTTLYY